MSSIECNYMYTSDYFFSYLICRKWSGQLYKNNNIRIVVKKNHKTSLEETIVRNLKLPEVSGLEVIACLDAWIGNYELNMNA